MDETTCCTAGETPRSRKWHYSRGLPVCRRAYEHDKAYLNRPGVVRVKVNGREQVWVPGTPILVPENDPL